LNIVKQKYKKSWLWNDVPSNILDKRFYKNYTLCDDIGCDLLAKNIDNTFDYIQCKNYSTLGIDNTISHHNSIISAILLPNRLCSC
jgi:predicted helicase